MTFDNKDDEEQSVVETVYVSEKPYTPAKDYSWMGFGILVFWLLWQILVIVIGALYLVITDKKDLSLSTALLLSIFCELSAFPVYYLIVKKKIVAEELPKSRLKFSRLFIYIGVVFFLGIAGNIIGIVLNSVISSNGGKASVSNVSDYIKSNYLAMFLYAGIVGPIIEEWLCRKIMLDRLHRYGKGIAMVTSGLLFALLHGNLEQFFYTFFVGFFFAYIYIKTGRVRYSIILHMSMNIYSVILTYVVSKIPALNTSEDATTIVKNIMSDDTQAIMILVLFAMIIFEYGMALAGLIFSIVRFREYSLGDENTASAPINKCFINPGMTAVFVLLFLDMVLTVMDSSLAEVVIDGIKSMIGVFK